MDISGQVASIHMRTDPKNLVTTARTTHLPEQKETIHIISMLRKEACSGSIHDLAHIPTQNVLADCLTKATAKADNLITAVKTGRFLDVDIHPNFRTLMEQKAFMSTWCRTIYAHNGEGCFLPECFEDVFRTNSTRRTIPCDVCENSHVFRKSRCYENNVCTCGLTHLFLLDDGVIFGENITFVLDSCVHF